MDIQNPCPDAPVICDQNRHFSASMISHEAAFGYPRDFLENRFVYLVVSPRAGGLSVGINLNPIANCNFCCVYCEVERKQSSRAPRLEVDGMIEELIQTLRLAAQGGLRRRQPYADFPDDLMQVRHVALSGDGEPTLARQFPSVGFRFSRSFF